MKSNLQRNTSELTHSAERITRAEPCRICGSANAIRIGTVEYWDIRSSDLVRCPACNHIQLDPMLSETETAAGCLAYYVEESLRTSPHEAERNRIRNFRRGVLFGYSLKMRSLKPGNILEAGPGSGHFAAGVRFVFPAAKLTVMDVNPEVLEFNRTVHGFDAIQGIPDRFETQLAGKFDLVIARDLLEHVTDIKAVVANFARYLVPGGHLHFTTPNGKEDVWKHILAAERSAGPSELMINHVNYFDGKGLKNLLATMGFSPVQYYAYGFKRFLRGAGWKHKASLVAAPSQRCPVSDFPAEKLSGIRTIIPESVPRAWYIRPRAKRITWLYSLYQHASFARLDPVRNIGHEFYGLFTLRKGL